MGPRLSCYVPQVVGEEGVEAGIAFGMAEKAAVVVGGPAIGADFETDKAGGAVDGDPSLRRGRL